MNICCIAKLATHMWVTTCDIIAKAHCCPLTTVSEQLEACWQTLKMLQKKNAKSAMRSLSCLRQFVTKTVPKKSSSTIFNRNHFSCQLLCLSWNSSNFSRSSVEVCSSMRPSLNPKCFVFSNSYEVLNKKFCKVCHSKDLRTMFIMFTGLSDDLCDCSTNSYRIHF